MSPDTTIDKWYELSANMDKAGRNSSEHPIRDDGDHGM